MSETIEKQLVSAFSEAWNETAPALLQKPSELKLLSLREVAGEKVDNALAASSAWSAAFVLTCEGAVGGIAVCLLKADDSALLESIAGDEKEPDGKPAIGGREVINDIFGAAATRLTEALAQSVNFGAAQYVDLTKDESYLSSIVGTAAWIGTFALTIGTDPETQLLFLYDPQDSLQPGAAGRGRAATLAGSTAATTPHTAAEFAMRPAPSSPAKQQRDGGARNIERLMDVELDVVVRFGATSLPLRDVVGMGTGSMIELNRSVSEPVDLLVNGRQFARGEVVVIDGCYGVRVTEVKSLAEKASSLI